jgi:uncharacterized membrane protein YhaH (DUF805 family)
MEMTYLEAAQQPLGSLLVFAGRSSRKEFWSFLLAMLVVAQIVALTLRSAAPDLLIALGFPLLILEYLLIWAVAVRRLHDTGRSGWMLLVSMIPLIGLLVLVVWFATASDAGSNRYGPSPLS